MSYKTFNIIVKTENDENEIKEYLSNNFKFFNVKQFFEPFSGVVCQANEKWQEYPYEKFPDNFFKNQDEVENYFGGQIEEKVSQLTSKFPEKEIAFVYVDCFGGQCWSEGYVIKNGEKSLVQESNHSGHQTILRKVYPNYNSWFFYPFTRTYFSDKGGINGDIINFSFMAIWMAVNKEVENNSEFNLQAAENEMFLDCPNKFNLYFMKISDDWIKIMGSILVDDKEIYVNVKTVIEDIFLGLEYNIQIDNFENGESTILSTIDESKNIQIKSTSYRATGFNTRSIDLNISDALESNRTSKSETKRKGFWSKLFGK